MCINQRIITTYSIVCSNPIKTLNVRSFFVGSQKPRGSRTTPCSDEVNARTINSIEPILTRGFVATYLAPQLVSAK